ncbi:hypothetical protein OSB04_009143 [Centaurea solstitialis]|uniref:At2g35280-like TPR domain-containing protein n=1 Tax=Centaurea solstitialis TaxID=347529 RepID=A0AA38TN47_9ASTR|nr:hypothetical protein OSB04_009143 [Centaurea solstitialis]
MKTRRGICYPVVMNTMCYEKRRRDSSSNLAGAQTIISRKRLKSPVETASGDCDFFDTLPDDIVLSILAKLGSTASNPADFISVLSTCKRFNGLGQNSLVLSKASPNCFAVKAENWSESCHRFLKRCSDSGNAEASYTLGMIRFYCLQNRGGGAAQWRRRDSISRSGFVLACSDPIQRQRRPEERQGPPSWRRVMRTRRLPRPRGRAPRARTLPTGWLRNPQKHRRRPAAADPSQCPRACRRAVHHSGDVVFRQAVLTWNPSLTSPPAATAVIYSAISDVTFRPHASSGEPVPCGLVRRKAAVSELGCARTAVREAGDEAA